MARWERASSITSRIQTLLLLLCFVFLLLPSLGPPVASIFRLQSFTTKDGRHITVGPFGYCADGKCSRPSVGYDLGRVLELASNRSDVLATTSFITIPIAGGIALLGTLVSASGHHIGSAVFAALCGVVVDIVSTVAVAMCYITLDGAADVFARAGATSSAGNGRWMLVVACVLSGFCWILGIVECCLARKHKKRSRDVEYVPVGVVPIGLQGQSAGLIANQAPMGE